MMDDTYISLAEAKARLSEITRLAAAGETVVITRRGKPLAQLSRVENRRKPIDADLLRNLTQSIPARKESAGEFMRRLRDGERY